VKVGQGGDSQAGSAVAGGVGKYLNLGTKRNVDTLAGDQGTDALGGDAGGKKKRRIGFGNFDNW
jgi:peptidyl-prolyl cis-trans isomerase-like 2